jgi:hypothetical protein
VIDRSHDNVRPDPARLLYSTAVRRNTLRAALNHAKREDLVERNVAELVTLPKARKKPQRRNSWTVTKPAGSSNRRDATTTRSTRSGY